MDFDRIIAGHEQPQPQHTLHTLIAKAKDGNNALIKQKATYASDALAAYVDELKARDHRPMSSHVLIHKRKEALSSIIELCAATAAQANFEETKARTKESQNPHLMTSEGGEFAFLRHGVHFASQKTPVELQIAGKKHAEKLFKEFEQSLGIHSDRLSR